MAIDLDSYVDVSERIATFREKHPDGSLQPWDKAKPYAIEDIGGQLYVVVVAAAYRSPEDTLPGVGMAYEAFPGRTPYTKGSELQNAETSAWGRAIVAALAADTKRGIASSDEVRNRQAERDIPPPTAADTARHDLRETLKFKKIALQAAVIKFGEDGHGELKDSTDVAAIKALTQYYRGLK